MLELPIEAIVDERVLPDGQREIGASRDGRPIHGFRLGHGDLAVSLIAGCHADEPVGPAMLDRLASMLAQLPSEHPLMARFSWYLVPHVNPDGEVRNRAWTEVTVEAEDHRGEPDRGFALALYLDRVVRELPGDDVEFGFPRSAEDGEARPENLAVAAFLAGGAPFALHASFHGTGFTHGPWFLLDPFWVRRTEKLRGDLARRVRAMSYRLHEVDRGGDKGFWRIDTGFTTRPDSRSMRDFFLAQGDEETAARFRPSSMEHVRALGGDPLTLVSEMPLFLLPEKGPLADPLLPRLERLALIAEGLHRGDASGENLAMKPMPIGDQMRLQLAFLEEGLRAVGGRW